MKRIHYISGLTISVFVGLHLFNHFSSIYGIESHIKLMNIFRGIYRNILAETLLLATVLMQIVSGIKLYFGKRKSVSGFFERLQVWSGLYLAFFLIIHVCAVLFGRFILNLDTNFYFGVAGLNTYPFNLFFVPYYGFAIISFFCHVSAIHSKKMKSNFLGFAPEKQSMVILIAGIFLTLTIFYGLTDGFNGVEIPEEYNVLIGK